MSSSPGDATRDLPVTPNPYTDDNPLVATDHPWRDNRAAVWLAALVLALPVALVGIRLAQSASPVFNGQLIFAMWIGIPLAALILAFPYFMASRVRVTLGDTYLSRQIAARSGKSKSIELSEIVGGIYASQVKYRREPGKELVLFLPERDILWIADGLNADDIQRIAEALSSYGIKEYTMPITGEKLQALVRKARRDQ